MPYALGMAADRSRLRRTLLNAAKLALAGALLAYLLNQARQHDAFSQLVQQPKQWPLLAAALASTFVAATLSFVRWHLLIIAVGISIKLLDTLRFAALGYALNFVSLGAIGGDLFKAILLAHGQPGRRTEAVATVVADRILGLTTMLILASVGILASGLRHRAPPTLAALCNTILAVTVLAIIGATLVLCVPFLTGSRLTSWMQSIPVVGTTLARFLGAARAYRDEKGMLIAAAIVSIISNFGYVTAFYLVAAGLPIAQPPYLEHFVIVPVANMVGSIPATPSGLGTKEAAVDLLYRTMPGGERIASGVGTMVTLAHRVTEMAVALLGLVYYLSHRKEVSQVYAEAEQPAETK